MKKAFLNWRSFTLGIIGTFAALFTFCTPTEDCSLSEFFLSLLWTKSLAVATGYAYYKLYTHWTKQGHLKDLNDYIDKEDETLWKN